MGSGKTHGQLYVNALTTFASDKGEKCKGSMGIKMQI